MARPTKWTVERVEEEVNFFEEYIKTTTVPLIYRFSANRGYGYQRWSEWVKNEKFSDTVKKSIREVMDSCTTKCTAALIEGGLANKFDRVIVIFSLKNVAGWRDDPTQIINIKAEAQANAASVDPESVRQRLGENVELFERYRHIPELSLKKE